MKKMIGVASLLVGMAALTFAAGNQQQGSQQTTQQQSQKPAVQLQYPWQDPVSDDPDKLLPGVDPSKVKGNIITAGSSTVAPLSETIAARFKKEGYKDQLTIDVIGTGAGFERFCKTGETDIANASRLIKQSELDWAKAIGRRPIEFRIATDALTICVSKSNTFVKDITMEELAAIFSTATYWSDVRPEWPKNEILRFTPGTDSGTFDYFVEETFKKNKEPLLKAKNLQLSEDDNVLVRGISGSPYAIGFFGYSYYAENKDKLNAVAINGVVPSDETVNKGTYKPFARPLFIYSDPLIMKNKPQVAAFIAYYLTYVNQEVKAHGFFPAPKEELIKAKQNWLEAMK
ncbi:MAG: PstS family phosphate ABC transporter substrate-binding protein [Treponemataceae bacterium]|nr:PstS family phosphate ABC transporter substrate-binding protein [Treponemataceae bacterium]